MPCWVEDLSADGAKLHVGCGPAAFVVNEQLPNIAAVAARLVRHYRDRIGVQFCGSERWLVELALRPTGTDDWLPITAHWDALGR